MMSETLAKIFFVLRRATLRDKPSGKVYPHAIIAKIDNVIQSMAN